MGSSKANTFANLFHVFDDQYAIIENGLFETHLEYIYLEEIQLPKEKREIKVSIYLLFYSNTPSKTFYSFNSSTMLLLTKNTSDHFTYIRVVNKSLNGMSKQEIRNKKIKILLNKILDHHSVLRYLVNLQLHLIASIYFFFLNCKYELKYKATINDCPVTSYLSYSLQFCVSGYLHLNQLIH